MGKQPVTILGIKYESKAFAAKQLGISKYPLYALLNSDEKITKTKLNKLKMAKGKKQFTIPIKVDDEQFPSITAAAVKFGIDHNALWNALDGKTEVSLSFIKKLQSSKRGYHKQPVKINGTAYPSKTAAAKELNLTRQFIDRCVSRAASDNIEIDLFTPQAIDNIDKSTTEFLRSKAEACGLVTLQDWYVKRRESLRGYETVQNILKQFWKGDILFAVSKLFPNQTVCWWYFHKTPNGVLNKLHLRRQYMDWLEQKLGYQSETDWYKVQQTDFDTNYGNSLTAYMGGILPVLKDYYLNFNWEPWLFAVAPNKSWQSLKTQETFLKYLEKQLKIKSAEQWYDFNITAEIHKNGGRSLLKEYSNFFDLLQTLRPKTNWNFWKFKKSARGLWHNKERQVEYLNWLSDTLGLVGYQDWYDVTSADFEANYGVSLLGLYSASVSECVMTILDEHPWEKIFFYKNEFKRERRLYGIIACGLPKFKVHFRYKHPQISHRLSNRPMEFDVFVEELNLGIEYQGQQHYEPIERFDGKDKAKAIESFQHRLLLDQEKREQAQKLQLNFWEIKYSDWDGSLAYIIKQLKLKFDINLEREIILKNASKRGFLNEEIIYSSD